MNNVFIFCLFFYFKLQKNSPHFGKKIKFYIGDTLTTKITFYTIYSYFNSI